MRAHMRGSARWSRQSAPMCFAYSSCIAGASQVRTCTPLVMWPTGTSSSRWCGQSTCHDLRVMRPCSAETPFA